jgi:hypothetical protein
VIGPGLAERNAAAGCSVTPESCRSLGNGDAYDLGFTMDALLTLRGRQAA